MPIRRSFVLALLVLCPSLAGADPYVIRGVDHSDPWASAPSAPSGGYGGGFLEMLMTGRAAPTPGTPAYNAPSDYRAAPPRERRPALQPVSYGPVAAPPLRREIDPMFHRQEVDYQGHEAPGTIVVDTAHKFLFLVQGDHRALRYGIGVGREGFAWSGVERISRKAEWPGWTPPPEMLKRRPDLPAHMDGGPANPLGARALYLGSSLYRIHGTNEPETIGKSVSSGCIRMMNADVEDLYGRVGVGTKVLVL